MCSSPIAIFKSRFPLRGRPCGENLLVWTTTPGRCRATGGGGLNPGADILSEGQAPRAGLLRRPGSIHGPAVGGAVQEREDESGSTACRGLKTLEQIFKEKGRLRDRRRGQGRGTGRPGLRRSLRDELPIQQNHPLHASPRDEKAYRPASRGSWAARTSRLAISIASSPGRTSGETEKYGRGAPRSGLQQKEDFLLGKNRVCRR